ncbi:penicillin acylase family protein [Chloroflexota bacterium]
MTSTIAVFIPLIVLLLGAGAALLYIVRRPLPKTSGTARVRGLAGQAPDKPRGQAPSRPRGQAPSRPREPVEIIRDRWGVPHIYAGSEDDLFFAQGYVHAQDRFWQMELQRRAGSGRLSEIFGETTLEADRFLRVIGINRAALADLEALDAGTRDALESYADGVNAYMASHRGSLSLEFDLLRYQPEPWQPVDGLYLAKLLAWNLSANWASEVIRARIAGKVGADLAADLEPEFPVDNPAIVSGSGMAHDTPAPPNGWSSAALAEMLRPIEGLFTEASSFKEIHSSPTGLASGPGSSNQWVVSGSRSATGQPLLANDTHLPLTTPSTWYQVHLRGGGVHVAGVSFPGLPGVVVGHNEHCAWGLTTAFQDAQDLYIERMNPEDPRQYQFQGAWLDAALVREEIQVKGWESLHIQEVVITHHGPIITDLIEEKLPLAPERARGLAPDKARGLAHERARELALRWVGHEPANILGSVLRYMTAASWEEFRSALQDWSCPAHNFVYADIDGNIAYMQAGWVPVRASGYGLVPVLGWTGETEWQGYLSLDQLPQAYNPDTGWLATANNLVVDETYPHFISADVDNPTRARRVVELVTGKAHMTSADFCRFQLDTYSSQAAEFVRHLLRAVPQTEEESIAPSPWFAEALAALEEWDHHLEADSVAASIYRVTRLRALHIFFDGHLGDVAPDYIGSSQLSPLVSYGPFHGRSVVRLLSLLEGPGDDIWLRDPTNGSPRSRSALLHQALREGLAELGDHLGPDMSQWQWGRLNRVHFAHPVGSVKPLHRLFNRGPYPIGGDQDTLLRSTTPPEFPFEPVLVGDAVRFVADLSDWDRCQIMIPGGQSGHAASRHYADRIAPWLQGIYQPMPFSREAVEQHAAKRLRLACPA